MYKNAKPWRRGKPGIVMALQKLTIHRVTDIGKPEASRENVLNDLSGISFKLHAVKAIVTVV